MIPLVTMRPGYSVPPVTRPRGCQVPVDVLCPLVWLFDRELGLGDTYDHRTSPKNCRSHSVRDISLL
jgi:hypothetical protein